MILQIHMCNTFQDSRDYKRHSCTETETAAAVTEVVVLILFAGVVVGQLRMLTKCWSAVAVAAVDLSALLLLS